MMFQTLHTCCIIWNECRGALLPVSVISLIFYKKYCIIKRQHKSWWKLKGCKDKHSSVAYYFFSSFW